MAEFKKLLQADLAKKREPITGNEIHREPSSMKAMQVPNLLVPGEARMKFYEQELANTPPGQPKPNPPAPMLKERD